jgi:3-hydroxymyristoyl/3-hydroxydecanoyl-(acyl carrier protein) dehydratase
MIDSDAAPRFPTILSREAKSGSLDLVLFVPENLFWFNGHFPGEPILPAIVQVDWAVHYGRDLGCDPRNFVGMPRLKFKVVIAPDSELKLSLAWQNSRLKFSYTDHPVTHSEGVFEFSS